MNGDPHDRRKDKASQVHDPVHKISACMKGRLKIHAPVYREDVKIDGQSHNASISISMVIY